MKTEVYLVRHAESAPHPDVDEPRWPLSDEGARQVDALREDLSALGVDAIYSSPFDRAIATVRPFADEAGLTVNIVDDLRERKLTEGMIDNWREVLERAWRDFDFALPGCESSRSCQQRVVGCIRELATRNPGSTILASSHGNAIGLCLNALSPDFGFTQWSKLRNPDLFKIVVEESTLHWDTSFVFEPRDARPADNI